MKLRDAERLTKGFDPLKANEVLYHLWAPTEGDVLTALRRVIYHHRAADLAALVEAALSEATEDLERLEAARDQAVAEVDALRAEHDVAWVELNRMGRGTPRATRTPVEARLRKLARALEVANREATNAIGQHRAATQRLTGMGRLLAELRATEEPDPDVLAMLAEALNGAG